MPKFRELVAEHPEVLRPRSELCFERTNEPSMIAGKWRETGVVMLRDVLRPKVLSESRRAFHDFIETRIKPAADQRAHPHGILEGDDGPAAEWDKGEILYGSWHAPWTIRHDGRAPMAMIVAELVGSWAWPVIEEICGSSEVVVMFGLCLGRHNIDQDLKVGVHQDATAVNPDLPLAIWIPLQEVVPKRHSGLGFIVPSPDTVIPAEPNNDIGEHYVLDNLNRLWVPRYHAGDLTIHSRYSPHFTTGYGTLSDRYSLEVRLWAHDDAFRKYGDPSVMISRRNGVPVITETRCSKGVGAHSFIVSAAQLAMERVNSQENDKPSGLMDRLRKSVSGTLAARS
jgi:hypothetical protein